MTTDEAPVAERERPKPLLSLAIAETEAGILMVEQVTACSSCGKSHVIQYLGWREIATRFLQLAGASDEQARENEAVTGWTWSTARRHEALCFTPTPGGPLPGVRRLTEDTR